MQNIGNLLFVWATRCLPHITSHKHSSEAQKYPDERLFEIWQCSKLPFTEKIPSVDFLSVVKCFEQSLDHFAFALLNFATAKNLHHDFLDQLEAK